MTIDTKIKIQMPAMPDFLKANFELSRDAQVTVEIDIASLTDDGVEQFITEWTNAFREHVSKRREARNPKSPENQWTRPYTYTGETAKPTPESANPYRDLHGKRVKVTYKDFDGAFKDFGTLDSLTNANMIFVGNMGIGIANVISIAEEPE